jgi:hypothetical protein
MQWFWKSSLRRVIWLAPVVWAIHEVEEIVFDVVAFEHGHFLQLPPRALGPPPPIDPLIIVAINGFIWTALTAWPKNPRVAAHLTLPFFVYFSFANALQHVYWSAYFQTYQPGAVTAVLLVAPAVVALTVKAVRDNLIALWYAATLYAKVLPTMVATYRAGNVMPVLPWPVN